MSDEKKEPTAGPELGFMPSTREIEAEIEFLIDRAYKKPVFRDHYEPWVEELKDLLEEAVKDRDYFLR